MKRDNQAWAAKDVGNPLEPWSYEMGDPGSREVVIRVVTCGICHSDLHAIDNDWQMSEYPLVPGHEVVGVVEEVGSEVTHLRTGQRVGVGWLQNACLHCHECLHGNENLCSEGEALIFDGYGGFADYVKVDSHFAFPLPDGISDESAGPLLCGGITVFSGLREAGMTSGQRIGVIGVGGLGHMAVQFASKLGNRVTVFTTSDDKARFASELGAHEAIVVDGRTPPKLESRFDIILSTAPADLDWNAYLQLLASDGTLNFVGVPPSNVEFPIFSLLPKRRRVMASPTGGRADIVDMLKVANDFEIAPVTETFPMKEVNRAIEKVRKNQVRYRAVVCAE
jgi:uncharacterized zinc-type alcohol dehydrogenase-like protein